MPNVLCMMVGFYFQGQMEISFEFLGAGKRGIYSVAFPTIIMLKSASISET